VVLTDSSQESERHIILEGAARDVYVHCLDEGRSLDSVAHATGLKPDEALSLLREMEDQEVLFASDGRFLALAIPE
jgi:hypothetical protein